MADWGGPVDPYIQVNFEKVTVQDDSDPMVSLIIFEWKDEELIGRKLPGSENVCLLRRHDTVLAADSDLLAGRMDMYR